MKIAFMGTPDFAVPSLERLIDSSHEVVLVVTQPSRPKGRGKQIADPPVKLLAEKHGLLVIQPASLRKEPLDEKIRTLGVDVLVVVAYGKILPESLLAAPRIGSLNLHASLLPEYRGAAPIQRALMDGRLETGVTIMEIVPELDAGPIVAQGKIEIHDDDDALSVSNYLSVLGADMLMRVLKDVETEGAIIGEPQDDTLATYAAMLTKEDGMIPWDETSERIMCRMRALTPWPGCFTMVGEKRLQVTQAEPINKDEAKHHGAKGGESPGTVAALMKGFGLIVRTGDSYLLVTHVQPEGKNIMSAEAFLNGNPIRPGARLG